MPQDNQQRTVRLDLQLDVNVHLVRAAQRQMDVPFGVARSRIRAAVRNFLLEELPSAALAVNDDGGAELGFAGEEGFTQGDKGIVDASLLFGRPSPFAESSEG